MNRIYWGDIHNHNEIGYAEGTLDRSFLIAENSLDFYAFTPHGWWTDVPKNDEGVRRHHEEGFAKVKARWAEVRRTVEEKNTPGRFVTIPGWEWHSLAWGDYCVYFPDDQAELHYAGTLEELKEVVRRTGALMVPHHPGYRLGWRGLDWETLDPELSPVVEVFSEHGNSLEPSSPWGMYGHSMGGIERSQSGLAQLRNGRQFGFLASGDDHFGYPGCYGQGLTAVLAGELNRGEILGALKNRHTYAVTGDRIAVDWRINDGLPGDVVDIAGGVSLRGEIAGRDRIRMVEILKNGRVWKRWGSEKWEVDPAGGNGILGEREEHLARIEWGWDQLSSEKITTWNISVRAEDSILGDLSPAFVGGAGSVVETNLLHQGDERSFRISSYTSRKNVAPTSSLSFLWTGPARSRMIIEVIGENGGVGFQGRLEVGKDDLRETDAYLSAFDRFSSPKLKVHALIGRAERFATIRAEDEAAAAGDFYLLKVEQENGQLAWCSPIWMTGGMR